MKDELSVNDNTTSDLTNRLRQLTIVRAMRCLLGSAAVKANTRIVAPSRQLASPTASRSTRFIQSLSALRRPQTVAQTKAEIDHVVEQSNEVLASASTFFPVTLFPDSIILDRTAVWLADHRDSRSKLGRSFHDPSLYQRRRHPYETYDTRVRHRAAQQYRLRPLIT